MPTGTSEQYHIHFQVQLPPPSPSGRREGFMSTVCLGPCVSPPVQVSKKGSEIRGVRQGSFGFDWASNIISGP